MVGWTLKDERVVKGFPLLPIIHGSKLNHFFPRSFAQDGDYNFSLGGSDYTGSLVIYFGLTFLDQNKTSQSHLFRQTYIGGTVDKKSLNRCYLFSVY